ncbi:hypothetical protein [Allomesorhizobium alhagi]|uniref:PD(D/E)XK endonuclease domain-containing protein n=1 Tax=Mesorhizobium alhagi CCNWXJ12-2 TaxID=1107882 RepID=H0HM83_9HYPH|nr:hypothetical protein [Mesorhizobium alhagi]EHK58168.1 hypothetical protein MAXJ12_06233 [Mesorhizobium alhagi CCNWXJ12-2]
MSGYNTGIAAEYFVLSQLYRQGHEAYVTLGNRKAIDIRVVFPGEQAISIDVKSVRGYSSIPMNNVLIAPHHFIICVIYRNRFEKLEYFPDVYVVPSEELGAILRDFNGQLRLFRGPLDRFLNAWHLLARDVPPAV